MSTNLSSHEQEIESLVKELVPKGCNCGYCFLKTYLVSCHPQRRMLVQLKCIEKYKWHIGELENFDCGWNEAINRWAKDGFAQKFDEVYSSELHIDEVFFLCMN